jgi:transcriptional regulator with XRE-family HTH domain
MTIQNPINEILKRYGYSRDELALKTGLSYGTIGGILKGRASTIQPRTAKRLAPFLQVTIADMTQQYAEWRAQFLETPFEPDVQRLLESGNQAGKSTAVLEEVTRRVGGKR